MVKEKINRATSRALLFLIFTSLRFLSLEKISIVFLPFLLVSDSTFFLVNIGLIPVALFLLLMALIIKLARKIQTGLGSS